MPSSVRSGVITLLHTACGAGILAMPYAFKPFGLVPGISMLMFCGLCSMLGLLLQAKVSKYVPERAVSFFGLTQVINPRLSILFDLAIAIKCFGVGVSYIIVVGDLLPKIVSTITSNEWVISRNFQITFVMVCIVGPLSFLKNLNSLRYTTMVAIASVLYLCMLVLAHSIWPSQDILDLKGSVSLGIPHGENSPLTTLPIFVFAYTCHHNMFSVINEQKDPSFRNVKYIALIAIPLAFVLYITIGCSGYLTFGSNIVGNIITLYPHSLSTMIGRIAIVLIVMLAFPLQCHPARASINHIVHSFYADKDKPSTSETTNLIVPTEEVIEEEFLEQQQPFQDVPLDKTHFIIITSAILLASYAVALSVASLAQVLAIVGATGSTSISFILPGLFGFQLIGSEHENFKSMPTTTKFFKITALLLCIWGIIVMITSLIAAIVLGATH